METINVTKQEIETMPLFHKGGYEGKLRIYKTNLILKQFENYLGITPEIIENKKLKLIRFSEKNIPDSILAKPVALVYVEGQFSAYLMKKVNSTIVIDHEKNYRKILLYYISLFQKLQFLHQHNITIGDLKPSNIVGTTFVDIDSMGIDELPMEYDNIVPSFAKKDKLIFQKLKSNDRKEIDRLLLLYCFLNTLSKENKNFSFSYLLGQSDLSDKAKVALSIYINSERLDSSFDILSLLEEEKNRKK